MTPSSYDHSRFLFSQPPFPALVRATLLPLLVLSLSTNIACGGGEEPLDAPPTPVVEEEHPCGAMQAEPMLALITQLDIVPEEDGVSVGMNLDGLVSDSDDRQGCRKADFVSPQGAEGIDNQFSQLLPALQTVGGSEGFESAVQRTINNGDVLLMLETQRVDDPVEDDCVEVTVLRAAGRPVVGQDGLIESGQTFDVDTKAPSSDPQSGEIHDRHLQAGPFELEVPMQVSTFNLFLTIKRVQIQATINDQGELEGVLAGTLVVKDMLQLIEDISDGTSLLKVISTVLRNSADMAPDEGGVCRELSIALRFKATPAFLFPSEEIEGEAIE